MPVAAVIGKVVVSKAIGAIGSKLASKKANKRGDQLSAASVAEGENLSEISADLTSRSDDRWNFYKDHGENVDILLLDDAVKMFKETFAGGSERAAARAAEDVATAFDRSADVRRRAALRFGGVDPSSGKFQGLERTTAIARAEAEAGARFSARRTEEDRARSVLNNASNVANRAINDSQRFSAGAVGAGTAAGRIFTGGEASARADAAGSAALVGDIAGRIPFDRLFDKPVAEGGGSAVSDSSTGFDGTIEDLTNSGVRLKKGGKIPGYRRGGSIGAIPHDGRGGGRIKGPGTGTSDSVKAVVDGTNRPIRLSAGEFIIPQKVVAQKGERFFNQLIGR